MGYLKGGIKDCLKIVEKQKYLGFIFRVMPGLFISFWDPSIVMYTNWVTVKFVRNGSPIFCLGTKNDYEWVCLCNALRNADKMVITFSCL